MPVWQFLKAYVLWPDSALDDAFRNIGTTEESSYSAMGRMQTQALVAPGPICSTQQLDEEEAAQVVSNTCSAGPPTSICVSVPS